MNFESYTLDEAIQDEEFSWLSNYKTKNNKNFDIENPKSIINISGSNEISVGNIILNGTHCLNAKLSWSILSANHLNDISLKSIQTLINMILEKRLNFYKVDHLAGHFEKLLVDNFETIIFRLIDVTGSIEVIVNWDAYSYYNSFFQPGSSFLFKQVSILNPYPGSKMYAIVTKRNVAVAISADGQMWPNDTPITLINNKNTISPKLLKIQHLSPHKKLDANVQPLDDTALCFDFENYDKTFEQPKTTADERNQEFITNSISSETIEISEKHIVPQEPLTSSISSEDFEDTSNTICNDNVEKPPFLNDQFVIPANAKTCNDAPLYSASHLKFASKTKERMFKFKFSDTLYDNESTSNDSIHFPNKKIVKHDENNLEFIGLEDDINFELDDLVKVQLPSSLQNCQNNISNQCNLNLFDEDNELDTLMCSLPHN